MKINHFYYRDGSKSVGPFTIEKLRELHLKGVIDTKVLVRSEDSEAWFEIENVLSRTRIEPVFSNELIEKSNEKYTENSGTPSVDVESMTERGLEHGGVSHIRDDQIYSEALTSNKSENEGWDLFGVAPWRRYFARLFDITLLGSLSWFLIGYTWYSLAPLQADMLFSNLNTLVDIVLTVFLGCLTSGIVLGAFGTTLGKAIFGIRIRTIRGEKITIADGISRDMNVYFKGMGLGIPIVSLITMISAFRKLNNNHQMSWDQGQFSVYYRKNTGKQIALTTLGIFLYIILVVIINAVSAT